MSIDVMDAGTRVVTPRQIARARDVERELAEWRCRNQEALLDTPVEFDETMLGEVLGAG